MHENIFAAFIALDKAEAFLRVEKLDLALARSDDLRRHSATTAATARSTAAIAAAKAAATTARPTEATAPIAAAAIIIEAVSAASAATEAIITAATPAATFHRRGSCAIHERIETVFTNIIALVTPPTATSFVVTHEPKKPSIPSFDFSWRCGRIIRQPGSDGLSPPLLPQAYSRKFGVTRTL